MEFDYKSRQFLKELEKLINFSQLPLTVLKYILIDTINQMNQQIEYNIAKYKKSLEEEDQKIQKE